MKKTFLIVLGAVSLFGPRCGGSLIGSTFHLADDKLQGRDVGSDGYRQAVEYVAGKFETFGLKPAGTSGYLQPVKFETRQLVEDQSGLTLVRNGKEETLERVDATMSSRADWAALLEAPMVFVGYGLVIPEAKFDELAGIDLRGKIAVYVNGTGPADAPGPVKSHFGSGVERWNALRKAGAVGIATIMNPRTPTGAAPPVAGDGSGRAGGGRGGAPGAQKSVSLADPALVETAGQQAVIAITRRGGDKFFAGSGHTMEEILKLATENKALPKFPLQGTLRAKAVVRRETMEASNVMGLLPGSDPKLKDEYVIMSAHLDHVGVGRAINGDTIYNGAMDDASGIASILEIARIMKQTGAKPKRSILFLAVAAEEKGELGSRYFAARPTVDGKQIVADINLDMFMPLFELKWIEVQGLGESTLGMRFARRRRKREWGCRRTRSRTKTGSSAAISTVSSGAACPRWRSSSATNSAPRRTRFFTTGSRTGITNRRTIWISRWIRRRRRNSTG